ncbi:hypothetical protein CVT26_003637 [Gymnopilus dilepis]|uniref:DUF967 domain protein n=1 Tax=Gymnopilus dilepis TaxID=231916 RepID=A0A409VSJ2_9AGAR|nr:hypothetical protein CVT26_003637 [Gymnopilus dilepis]
MSAFPPIEVLAKEPQTLVFQSFTADSAWILGGILRQLSLEHPQPVAIRITHANGQVLFSTYTRPGTNPDSESWIARKTASVFRWGTSTLHLGQKLREKGHKGDRLSETMVIDDSKYACHGGGFPIKVQGVEGVVAVAVISGLAQTEDHAIVVEGIKKYLREVEKREI